MSADLLITALVADEDRELYFEAADHVITGLEGTDILEPDCFDDDPDDPAGLAQIRAALRADLQALREAIDTYIDITQLHVRGATLYITGGMSWGEGPTRVWDVIARLRAARGVLAAAGFENEE